MHVVVNTSPLPVFKKYRITSLLCIFETIIKNQIKQNKNKLGESPLYSLFPVKTFLIDRKIIEKNLQIVHVINAISMFV